MKHTVIMVKIHTWHIRNINAWEMPYLGHGGWTKRPFARRFDSEDEAKKMRDLIVSHDPSKAGLLIVESH